QRFSSAGDRSWTWQTPADEISWGSPRTVPDGVGGVFVSWVEPLAHALLAQHLTATGVPAPNWPDSGLVVKSFRWSLTNPSTCSDGSGGMFVVWSEDEPDDVFAQHLRADGTIAAGWPVGGITVSGLPDHQEEAVAIPDGAGGIVVVWEDFRYRTSQDQIVPSAQRLTGTGEGAPGWVQDCIVLARTNSAWRVVPVQDGTGGAIVCWGSGNTPDPLRAQRIRGDGIHGPLLDQTTKGLLLLPAFPLPFTGIVSCDLLMERAE